MALALLAGASLRRVAALDLRGPIGAQATAILFGAWALVFWQLATQAFDVPKVLMPAPSQIWAALVARGNEGARQPQARGLCRR